MARESYLNPLFSWRGSIVASDLEAPTKHVALTLSLYMNERGGSAFPGVTRMVADTSLSDPTVRKHLRVLVDTGWLTIVEHGGIAGERKRANHYTATTPQADDPTSTLGGTPKAGDVDPPSSLTPKRQESAMESVGSDEPRKDLLFEALAEVCGMSLGELTTSARGAMNRAAKELRDLSATPAEVERRAQAYRKKYPGIDLTPSALAKHWPALSANGNGARATVPSPTSHWEGQKLSDEERDALAAYEAMEAAK